MFRLADRPNRDHSRHVSLLIVVLLSLAISGKTIAASPGSLDVSFGIAGVASKSFGASGRQEAKAVAAQPDGKIIVVGAFGTFTPMALDFIVMRYNADGSIDSAFGVGGVVITDFNSQNEEANAVAIQPDGKILVAGSLGSYGGGLTGFKIARYLSNGTLDNSFGNGGKATHGWLEFAGKVRSMMLQPDGKIVVAGDDGNPNLLIVRFNGDGTVDSDFGVGGEFLMTPNGLVYPELGRQSDGKIIVAGHAFNDTDSLTVYRLNANGTLDPNFGIGGKATKTYSSNNVFYRVVETELAVQADDKIIVSGSFNSNNQSSYPDSTPPLVRLNADGSFDPGFLPNTQTTRPVECVACTSKTGRILPLADGKFYLVGYSNRVSISRYLNNGSLDRAFGLDGTRYIRRVDYTSSVRDAAVQTDGKVVIAATGTTTFFETGLNLGYLLARVNPTVTPPSTPGDFDGDGLADLAVFRPSNRVWYILNSGDGSYTSTFFGLSTDTLVPGDYNFDRRTDIATYRSTSQWWIQPSSPGNGNYSTTYGNAGDIPVAGDFDGDGFTDSAVVRPSNNTWNLRYSSLSMYGTYTATVNFGLNGDRPVPGDYDGDGITDVAVFRPSTGVWWIRRSSDPQQLTATAFGLSTDEPVMGDYDGDGKTDIAVFRDGVWYVLKSSDGGVIIQQWGVAGDKPVPGDYDGDGKTDIGVFRPSSGDWYAIRSGDQSFLIQHWGANGDIPIPNRYLPN